MRFTHAALAKANVLRFQSRRWSRSVASLGYNPQVHRPMFTIATADYDDSSRVNAARRYKIGFESRSARLSLAPLRQKFPAAPTPRIGVASPAVIDYVACRVRLVSERDSEIVQPRLFVVAADVAEGVEDLGDGRFRPCRCTQ